MRCKNRTECYLKVATWLVLVSGPSLQLAQLDSGSDDSDLVSTSESEASDEDMEDEETQNAAEGGGADVEMATITGAAFHQNACSTIDLSWALHWLSRHVLNASAVLQAV